MANEQNLKSYYKGDPRASENGKKGAPISAQVRRRKANIAKTMSDLLTNQKTTIDGKELTYEAALCLIMLKEALSGNVAAARFVSDAVDSALKTKEIKSRIDKLKAETDALKAQQETMEGKESVVIIDDIGSEIE